MKILTLHEYMVEGMTELQILREIAINADYIVAFARGNVEMTAENITKCQKYDIDVESNNGRLGVEIKLINGEKVRAIEHYEYVKKFLAE